MGNKTRGLYPEGKFIVQRRDGTDKPGGKHDNCNYFVLDVTHDPHAIPALRSYAASARKEGYELLANDLEGIAAAATTPPSETAVGGETSMLDEAQRLLVECCYTINALADQQAMPDDSYKQTLEAVGYFMEAAPLPTAVDDKGKLNVIDALASALEVAINTVECASIDASSGEELPWCTGAKKALVLAGRRSDG